jgi:hypothetical protein
MGIGGMFHPNLWKTFVTHSCTQCIAIILPGFVQHFDRTFVLQDVAQYESIRMSWALKEVRILTMAVIGFETFS